MSGGTLTVAGPGGNTVAVKTNSDTKVTKVVQAAATDVTVGATVALHGTSTSAGSSTGASSASATIAADQVAILPASGVKPPPLANSPAGAFRGRGLAAGLAVGVVKSVTSTGFTVMAGTTVVTVTTSSSTTYSKTVPATVGDLTVGQPIAAVGTPNSDGSITAANIAQASAGTGLGRFPGLGFRPGFGPGTGPGPGPGGFGPGQGRAGIPTGSTTTVPAGSP